jgi:hypothetical protein
MPRSGWTPSLVPYGADQTVYLVIDRFAGSDPIRVVAFNTLEHWSKDVSEYIAFEIQSRCDIDAEDVSRIDPRFCR